MGSFACPQRLCQPQGCAEGCIGGLASRCAKGPPPYPEVARHFDGPITSAEDAGDKRMTAMVAAAATERQRMWVRKRVAPESRSAAWRPKKRHRTAAKVWAMILDQQVRTVTEHSGLAVFDKDRGGGDGDHASASLWSDWRRWPHLSLSSDQGSDALSGIHALMYKFRLNVSFFPDPSHACHRDVLMMLKTVGLYEFWLLLMVAMNLQHGPWHEDYRWVQLQEAWQQMFNRQRPHTCPLFQERGAAIAGELLGDEPIPEGDRLQAAWARAEELGVLRRKGYQVNLNRFLGSIDGAEKLLERWSSLLMACEFVALEEDMLKGKRFLDVVLAQDALQADEGVTSTSSKIVTAQERLLRSAAQNSLVITIMLLEEQQHKRLAMMVTTMVSPMKEWHGKQTRAIRDVFSAEKWFLEQVEGGLVQHLRAILELLGSAPVLSRCGFRVDLAQSEVEAELLVEDEFATKCGEIATELVRARIVRSLWMVEGWPGRFIAFTSSGSAATEAKCDFAADAEAFQSLMDTPVKTKQMALYARRSAFQLQAVRQFLLGFRELGWAEVHADIKALASSHGRGCLATQIVEDESNMMNNHKVIKGKKNIAGLRRATPSPWSPHSLTGSIPTPP